MEYTDYIWNCVRESSKIKEGLVAKAEDIEKIADSIVDCYKKEHKLLVCGNGGSAADAQHIAGELVGRFKMERRGLSAIALSTDSSVLTAWSNDYNYSNVFARQVQAHAKPYDILLGISTSGNSNNIIEAFETGREIGTFNISLTGEGGGKLKNLSDICLDVNSKDTPRIQEAHELIYHIICDLVEKKLFGDNK